MFLTVRFEHRGNAVGQRLAGFGGGFNPSPYFVNATKNTVIAAPGYYRSTVTGSMKMACQFIPPANAGGPEANFCSFTHTGKIDEIRADWNQILSPAVFYSPLIVQFSVVSYRN